MKLNVLVKNEGDPDKDAWTEVWKHVDVSNMPAAEAHVKQTVAQFNASLGKGEHRRVTLNIEMAEDDPEPEPLPRRCCNECGEDWLDDGETECPFCQSEDTEIVS